MTHFSTVGTPNVKMRWVFFLCKWMIILIQTSSKSPGQDLFILKQEKSGPFIWHSQQHCLFSWNPDVWILYSYWGLVFNIPWCFRSPWIYLLTCICSSVCNVTDTAKLTAKTKAIFVCKSNRWFYVPVIGKGWENYMWDLFRNVTGFDLPNLNTSTYNNE